MFVAAEMGGNSEGGRVCVAVFVCGVFVEGGECCLAACVLDGCWGGGV